MTKHEDAQFALSHAEYFSNEDATPFPRDPVVSLQDVLKLEDSIRSLANQLIDDIIDKGEWEFDIAFRCPLPVLVFLSLMGLRAICATLLSVRHGSARFQRPKNYGRYAEKDW